MASNNLEILCLKVPDPVEPQNFAFIMDLCGRYGLTELDDSDESMRNVIAQEAPNAEDKKAVNLITEGSGGVAQEPVLNAEVGNAEVRNAPNDEDKKTVVLVTEDAGGVVLKILSRLPALVGCAAVVYAACKIADGVDTWNEAGCKVELNWENLTIFKKFSIWST